MPDTPSEHPRWYNYFHPRYRRARAEARARSRGVCQGCGYALAEHAHHWLLFYLPPWATTSEHLTALCRVCHQVMTLLRRFLSMGGDPVRFLAIACLEKLPWTRRSEAPVDLARARAALDAGHAGLDDAKSCILEYLAGRRRNPRSGAVLCLAGPPGVGKTSLAKCTAEALGRGFGVLGRDGQRRGQRPALRRDDARPASCSSAR